jgi:Amt family ammonium transporter
MHPLKILVSSLILFISPTLLGQDNNAFNAADTAWILCCTALVLLMTLPGLALFYGGLVRSKNILSVLIQCFTIAAAMSLLWLAFGYSLAFGEGNTLIGDFSQLMRANISVNSLSGTIPEALFALFQMTFAIITPTLIIGGFAERMRFTAMLLFSCLWLIAVYIPVTHWVWGGGWLATIGLYDFAGGTVVHITAGVAALIAALVLGPRKGFGQIALPPHNLTMTVTGAGLLWVGWYGFNGGSALAANGSAAMAMLVTHISAAAGVLTWLLIERIKYGKPSVLGGVTGMVAGLGTITPASGFVGPGGAVIIGISAGFVCFWCTLWIKQKVKIDDSLDVFPVHGVGGILGTLLAGVFSSPDLGIFSGLGFNTGAGISTMGGQVWAQFIGVVATLVYTAIVSYILLKAINLVSPLRVDEESEVIGLDISEHDERGYDLS